MFSMQRKEMRLSLFGITQSFINTLETVFYAAKFFFERQNVHLDFSRFTFTLNYIQHKIAEVLYVAFAETMASDILETHT